MVTNRYYAYRDFYRLDPCWVIYDRHAGRGYDRPDYSQDDCLAVCEWLNSQ